MIETFKHGDLNAEERLYCLIGGWIVSEDVIDKIGMPVTARSGDLWWVAFDAKWQPSGFAQMRIQESGSAHIRYLFVVDGDTSQARSRLLMAIIATAKKNRKIHTVYTNDRETETFWARHKFKKIPHKRGVFCRFELTMEHDSENSEKPSV